MSQKSSIWTKGSIQSFIEKNCLGPAKCLNDGAIEFRYTLTSKKAHPISRVAKFAPGTEEYEVVTSFTGKLSPGDTYVFPQTEKQYHEVFTTEMVIDGIETGDYKKVEYSSSGDMKIYTWNKLINKFTTMIFPADCEQTLAVRKITGPIEPGVAFEFADKNN